MLAEKFIIIGILQGKNEIVDIIKDYSNSNNIIDTVRTVKELKNNIIVDFNSPFNTKSQALKRLSEIYNNRIDILHWSILPVIVDVSIKEARYLKLIKLRKKLFS